jgi:hypothetical protein
MGSCHTRADFRPQTWISRAIAPFWHTLEQLGEMVPDMASAARVAHRNEHLLERHDLRALKGVSKGPGNDTSCLAANRAFAGAWR